MDLLVSLESKAVNLPTQEVGQQVWGTWRRFRREKETLPGWPVIAVMATVWVAVMLLYWHVFGLPFHRNVLSYLMGAALIFLTVLKLLKSENG